MVKRLLTRLSRQRPRMFPSHDQPLLAPKTHGVYLISDKSGRVVHVGRTVRGKNGLLQRLKNHIHGSSSFALSHFSGKGSRLRGRYAFQLIEVPNDRTRALLEAAAIAWHCPVHLGLSALRK